MNQFYKLFLILLLAPFFSIAQGNYQPGVAVTLKGDTLHGYIDYRGWDSNPKAISFKSDPNGTISKFTTNDISYFGVSVGFLQEYRKFNVTISMDKTGVDNVSAERDSSFRIATVFLKVVQKGKNIVLYSYSDDIKTRYFISENSSDTPKELTYRIYFNCIESSVSGRTVYERPYRQQLYAVGVKVNVMNPALQSQIGKSEYSESDLINIAGSINGISDTESLKNGVAHPKAFKLAFALAGFVVIAALVLSKAHL